MVYKQYLKHLEDMHDVFVKSKIQEVIGTCSKQLSSSQFRDRPAGQAQRSQTHAAVTEDGE